MDVGLITLLLLYLTEVSSLFLLTMLLLTEFLLSVAVCTATGEL